MRILVVEDFDPLRESIVQGLHEAGFAVDGASDGEEGLWLAKSGEHDVVVLDLMLPRIDGLTVLRKLRLHDCPACILILTAKDTLKDRVHGLDLGADDYLVKPFGFEELLARIRALIRRKYEIGRNVLHVGDLEVDTSRRRVRLGDRLIDLSTREYALMEYLALNAHHYVTREDIWHHVYDMNATPESNVVDVFIGLLRRKIEQDGKPRLIHTKRGMGYMLGEAE